MAKRKPKSIAKLVDEVAILVQKYTRMKAADSNGYCKCSTCDAVKHWTEMQGGHFVGRKWLATKLLEENIHPQCPACNGPRQGNMIQYTLFMLDMYGKEFIEELEILKHQSRKYYRDEVAELKEEYTNKIKELEA